MNETVVIPTNSTKKDKKRLKKEKTIPIIQRTDIMSGLLCADLNHYERSRLSNLYAEITYMEKKDLKYISEIAVSSQSDVEIYEMLNRIKRTTKERNV